MTTRNWIWTALLAATLLGGAFGLSSSASAQEVQITGPLAGQPAVRRHRIYRDGRFEITPQVAFTLTDEYSRTIGLGASGTYHFNDWFGAGLWGFFAPIHIDTGLTDQVAELGQTAASNRLSLPTNTGFPDQIASLNWGAALQAVFIPLRGKLSLFQKLFVDTDFFVTAGLAFVGIEERADTAPGLCTVDDQACRDSQTARASRVAVTGTFSAGLRLYVNQWMALNLEWRALPFAWNTGGTDVDGKVDLDGDGGFSDGVVDAEDRAFQFNHMVTVGWTFYLPTEARISE